jgi:hypothetical protein
MFSGEISNIGNLNRMKRIDNYLILLIEVGDMGEKALETIRRLSPETKQMLNLSCCKFC